MANRVNIPPEEMDYALEFIVGSTLTIVKYWFDQDENIPIHQLIPLMYKLMDNRFVQELDIDMDYRLDFRELDANIDLHPTFVRRKSENTNKCLE